MAKFSMFNKENIWICQRFTMGESVDTFILCRVHYIHSAEVKGGIMKQLYVVCVVYIKKTLCFN